MKDLIDSVTGVLAAASLASGIAIGGLILTALEKIWKWLRGVGHGNV